jgi:hypothetical protein
MKNITTTFSIILILTLFSSCKKENNYNTFSDTPQANAAFDNSSSGIYKGVFIGSSGTIVMDIGNTTKDSNIVRITIDKQPFVFIQSRIQLLPNDSILIDFKNKNTDDDFFTFKTDKNGIFAKITNVHITGHPNIQFVVQKELSTRIVKCFEGSLGGDDNGVINAIQYGSEISSILRSTILNRTLSMKGSINGSKITGDPNSTVTISGNADSPFLWSGIWNNTAFNSAGTWIVIRTL